MAVQEGDVKPLGGSFELGTNFKSTILCPITMRWGYRLFFSDHPQHAAETTVHLIDIARASA